MANIQRLNGLAGPQMFRIKSPLLESTHSDAHTALRQKKEIHIHVLRETILS